MGGVEGVSGSVRVVVVVVACGGKQPFFQPQHNSISAVLSIDVRLCEVGRWP